MRTWLKQLDELLRGRLTAPELLAEGRVELPLGRFMPLAVVLGMTYGFFMGWFALLRGAPSASTQMIASMIKLPALFLLTLVVTLPSLYVFSALLGCRLSFRATLRLLVGAVVVNLAIAASFGPILGFFTLSTTSYSFMILLNVVLLAIGGLVGLGFLMQILRRLASWPPWVPTGPAAVDAANGYVAAPTPHPSDTLGQARSIFRVWLVIYSLVGMQMGWLLRPFVGSPDLPFAWFRVREGNFFLAVVAHLKTLLDQ